MASWVHIVRRWASELRIILLGKKHTSVLITPSNDSGKITVPASPSEPRIHLTVEEVQWQEDLVFCTIFSASIKKKREDDQYSELNRAEDCLQQQRNRKKHKKISLEKRVKEVEWQKDLILHKILCFEKEKGMTTINRIVYINKETSKQQKISLDTPYYCGGWLQGLQIRVVDNLWEVIHACRKKKWYVGHKSF